MARLFILQYIFKMDLPSAPNGEDPHKCVCGDWSERHARSALAPRSRVGALDLARMQACKEASLYLHSLRVHF